MAYLLSKMVGATGIKPVTLPCEESAHPSKHTVFEMVTEFLSSQSDLIRFVSDRFDLHFSDKKSPAEAGLFVVDFET